MDLHSAAWVNGDDVIDALQNAATDAEVTAGIRAMQHQYDQLASAARSLLYDIEHGKIMDVSTATAFSSSQGKVRSALR